MRRETIRDADLGGISAPAGDAVPNWCHGPTSATTGLTIRAITST